MARQANKRTDFGTVALHWLMVVSLLVLLATGLRLTSMTPGYEWIQIFDFILPAKSAWSLHILAGLVLFGIALGYVGYISHAGLSRRIWPDRARLVGLFGRRQARLSAINIILYWCFFAMMILLFVTGFLMYRGHGGQVVVLHRFASFGLLAFPIAHMAVHYGIGGYSQLLRIFRPTHLTPPPPPFDPFDMLLLPPPAPKAPPAHGQNGKSRRPAHRPIESVADEWRRSETMLQANPLVVAIAAAFTGVMLMLSVDRFDRDLLYLPRIDPADAPMLDGDVADHAWTLARPVYVETQQGLNFNGTGASRVEVRGVHDGKIAYFSFIWEDTTRSLKHLPLVKKKDGWHVVQRGLDYEDENAYHDDSFAVVITTTDLPSIRYPGGNTFHVGPKPLDDKPASFTGRGLHYTTSAFINDAWHWKASRGGMLGYCDDGAIGPPQQPTQDQVEGRARYYGGLVHDPGNPPSTLNFDQRAPGGYRRPIQPKRLPANPRAALQAMGQVFPDPETSESDGAVWWLTQADSVPYTPEADAQFPVGSIIPGVLILGNPTGDRADVRCAARWAAGRWSLEVARLLDTGSANDVVIGNRTAIRVAAFDHSQIGHTRHIRAIRMELE